MALSDAALKACYRRLEGPLYNVLYRWLWDAEECEDLMHEAFLRIWDRRDRVAVESLDALVYATALNLAKNKLRWRGLWRFGAVDPDAAALDDPSANAEQAQTEQRVRRALRKLPVAARNVLLLSEFSGLSTQEIASALGIPPGTVGSRKHHAMAALEKYLQDDAHE